MPYNRCYNRCRFYKVQYENVKQDVVGCTFVFVSNFLGCMSDKNWQNLMTSDEVIPYIKKGDVFLRHSVYTIIVIILLWLSRTVCQWKSFPNGIEWLIYDKKNR